jgi:glutaredoxin 3
MNSRQSAPLPVAKVDIYTERFSPDCMRAKGILDRKSVKYSEYIIDHDDESREVMIKRCGGPRSVPQIFINGRDIGGSEELEALEAAGQLDLMLAEKPRNLLAEEAARARAAAQERPDDGSGGLRNLLPRFLRP